MEDNSILLNGGNHLEVAVLPDAYPLLVRVLGGEPDRQEVLVLGSSQDDEGRERVAVSLDAERVGYLPVDIDPELLATIKACEINEAVPQARGSLQASWEEPGKVTVKVDLADPDDLLAAPDTQSTDEVGAEAGPSSASTSALEGAEAPALSTGRSEDYPDWPPPKPKPAIDDSPAIAAPISDAVQPSDAPDGTPPIDPALSPSPDALLATRSAWTGGPADRSEAPQAGWLGTTASATPQSPTIGSQSSSPGALAPMPGTPSEASSSPPAPLSQDSQTQSQTNPSSAPANDLDSEIIAAWGSSGSTDHTVTEPPVASKPRMNTNWVMPTVVAVLAIAIGLLVWKFVFAAKTYTDPEYGYSFKYPGRWEVFADSSMLSQFAYMLEGEEMPSMVMIGDGLDSNDFDEVAMLAVARAEASGYMDESQIAAELQSQFNDPEVAGLGVSIVEPLYPTTIGGLNGWKMTMSMGIGFYSMTISYCLLLDGDVVYMLMAAATGDAWDKNRKTFDRFFDSFEPG